MLGWLVATALAGVHAPVLPAVPVSLVGVQDDGAVLVREEHPPSDGGCGFVMPGEGWPPDPPHRHRLFRVQRQGVELLGSAVTAAAVGRVGTVVAWAEGDAVITERRGVRTVTPGLSEVHELHVVRGAVWAQVWEDRWTLRGLSAGSPRHTLSGRILWRPHPAIAGWRERLQPPVATVEGLATWAPQRDAAWLAHRGRLIRIDPELHLGLRLPFDETPRGLHVSPDGTRALAVHSDGVGVLWDAEGVVPMTAYGANFDDDRAPEWVHTRHGWQPAPDGSGAASRLCTDVGPYRFCVDHVLGPDVLAVDGPGGPSVAVVGVPVTSVTGGSEAGLFVVSPPDVFAVPHLGGGALGPPALVSGISSAQLLWPTHALRGEVLATWSDGVVGFARLTTLPFEPRPAPAPLPEPEVARPVVVPTDGGPRELVLAIDVTGSFREVRELRGPLLELVERAAPERAALVGFYHRYGQVRAALDAPGEALFAAIEGLDVPCKPFAWAPCPGPGPVELRDERGSDPSVGLRAALQLVGERPTRRTIVLVHDGITGPLAEGVERRRRGLEHPFPTHHGPWQASADEVRDTWRELAAQATAAGVTMWTVYFGPGPDPFACPQPGRCLQVDTVPALLDALAGIR